MSRLANAAKHQIAVLRLQAAALLPRPSVPALPVSVMGLEFRNPLGLAAGFDRHGGMLKRLEIAGFGFVEIGTVTAEGATRVSARLAARPASECRVAVNIGSLRPGLDAAVADDYRTCLRCLAPFADILVINLSCRRMARLRSVSPQAVMCFLAGLRDEGDRLADQLGRRVRLAVKLDMNMDEAIAAADAAVAVGLDGLMAVGGDVGRLVARVAPLPVIAIGSINRAGDVVDRLAMGASLVEVYTAFVDDGPGLPSRLLGEMLET